MNNKMKWVGTGVLFLLLVGGSFAAEQVKSYRWTVDRPMQLAGQMLDPGRYDVQVTYLDNQKAQIVIMQKDRTLIKTEALLEPKTGKR